MKAQGSALPQAAKLYARPMRDAVDRQALRQSLLALVALVYRVEHGPLLAPTRGRRPIARARQVAMYLAHVVGGLSLSDVGRLFHRDRTTVAHACSLIEDARDDEAFDRLLDYLEAALRQQMRLARASGEAGRRQ